MNHYSRFIPKSFLLILLFFSCDQDESTDSTVLISTTVHLSVQNSQSKSIFDTGVSELYSKESILIYYKENNTYKEYNFGNHGGYKGYSFSDEEELNLMTIYPYDLGQGVIPEHIIQWNDQDSDTLKFEVDVQNNGSYISVTKVWYNGDLAWDKATDNEIPIISVTK
jgi:hypothetical protein